MEYLILRVMINALSIMAAVKLVDGITFTGEWWKMIIIGAIFGLVNSFIKPLVQLLTLPLILFTLGLFTLIVNAFMLTLTAWLSGPLSLGLQIEGFRPAFWGALIVSLVSMLLSCLMGARKVRFYRNRGE
ncbi:MAG TPA: phage holin family protein [Thermodesulfovibrionales bacterium]|jgi:putative membrane protein|nr:phage holin family protein [Thermodesulfovibrionales bacterium]